MASSSISSTQKEIEDELKEAGNRLLMPPSSLDELLKLVDRVECVLSKVAQVPCISMQEALLPSMKALIANELLEHSDTNVKVSVVACLGEIMRITAPDSPYNDELMKRIFQLTIMALEKLSDVSDPCYYKAIHILENIAKVRSCLLMLDLECNALVVQMFQQFLSTIRPDHPDTVFMDMETIMTLVIEEAEEIPMEVLELLLVSIKKENQNISPLSWKLGKKVLKNCSAKLKTFPPEALKSTSLAINDFAEIISSVCDDAPGREDVNQVAEEAAPDIVCFGEIAKSVDGTSNSMMDDGTAQIGNNNTSEQRKSLKTLEHCEQTKQKKSIDPGNNLQNENLESTNVEQVETHAEAVPKRRGRKPNSLVKPEEGYDHSWVGGSNQSFEKSRRKKNHRKKIGFLPKHSPSKESTLPSEPEKENSHAFSSKTSHCQSMNVSLSQSPITPDGSHRRRGRPKRKESMLNQDGGLDLLLDPGSDLPRAQVKEEDSESAHVALKKDSEGTRDPKAKSKRGSKKRRLEAKTRVETTPALSNVDVKKEMEEEGIPSDLKGKQVVSLLQQKDGKKRSRGKTAPEKQVTEKSGDKNLVSPATKSLDRDENHMDGPLKTKRKRKHTPRKEEDSKVTHIKDYGEELVNCRIRVWWPLDQMFYEGIISSFDPLKMRHKVLYVDGDEEILNLSLERWELIANEASDREQEADRPSPAALSVKIRTKKGKTKSSHIKQEDSVSSSKRIRTKKGKTKLSHITQEDSVSSSKSETATDKSKTEAPKSGNESADKSTLANKLKDNITEGGLLKDDGHISIHKPETERPRTIVKLKRKLPQIVLKSKGENPRVETESHTSSEATKKSKSSHEELTGAVGKEKFSDSINAQERD